MMRVILEYAIHMNWHITEDFQDSYLHFCTVKVEISTRNLILLFLQMTFNISKIKS
jgi:hypothetical protein